MKETGMDFKHKEVININNGNVVCLDLSKYIDYLCNSFLFYEAKR